MNKKMRARKRRQARRVALTLVLMLTVALVSIGGTLAWLTDDTDPVVNTFTVGDINIELYETASATDNTKLYERTLNVLPGNNLFKNPTVEVSADSEACWLFVKVEEANWEQSKTVDGKTTTVDLRDKVTYSIANGWTQVPNVSGVYYREVAANTPAAKFDVIADNTVYVANILTKAELEIIETNPTLTFTAYAVQKDTNIANAADAWSVANTGNLPAAQG